MKHLRIKNKLRFTISMAVIFIFLFSIVNAISSKVFSYQQPQYDEVVVAYGDTLWTIASNLDGNIGENIYNIQKINNLENCNIFEGQILLIPSK